MENSVFFDTDFFMLVFSSLCVPLAVFAYLLCADEISRWAVLALGVVLVGLSGYDVYLLNALRLMAVQTPSVLDDEIFASRLSVMLYALPAFFAVLGGKLMAHIVLDEIRHRGGAAKRRPL